MQDSRQSRIATALNLFERLAALVVSKPEKLKISADITSVMVNLDITIHPDDFATLIGKRRRNLVQMETLLEMMLRGTGMEYYIPDVADTGEEKGELREWENPNWPREKVLKLLADLARACFPNERTAVEAKDVAAVGGVNKAGQRTRLNVLFERDVEGMGRFIKAVSLLFLPVSKVHGVKLLTDCKFVTGEDLIKRATA